MMTDAAEYMGQTIQRLLRDRFECRPYNRIAVTRPAHGGEPHLTVAAWTEGGDGQDSCQVCGVTLSLAVAADYEDRAVQALLELVSVLHDADLSADDIVVVDCAFRHARLERDALRERSFCHADFQLKVLLDCPELQDIGATGS